MHESNWKKLNKRKKIFSLFSIIIAVCLALFLTYYVGIRFMRIASSGVEFRGFIQSYGFYGIFVAVGIQFLQVFIALIPGEVIEIGMGFAYGWLWGTLLCLLGVGMASFFIFAFVKKFGIKFVGLFVSIDKINELKFINSEKKLKRFTFVLYLLPGTPKDLLTYFLGLTNLSVRDFLTITLFARIPSIVSSVVGGELIGNREYFKAIVLFIITAAISLIGLKIYKTITEKIKSKSKAKKGIADETAV
ncbi:MAG: TVP38/TMEM64 family protein [Ruminococcaceae bacterium]|nr:TVP38/TMEM64 family protein [Oscillospiraceae bacterium]